MSVWRPLMVHRFTLQKGAVSTTADPLHPGSSNRVVTFTTPAAEYTGLHGLFHRLTLDERASQGMAGTTVASHNLYLDLADAPAGLVDFDSTPAPEVLYRVVDVARADGASVDDGPFDIQQIEDLAGQGDVVRLELKRVN